MAETLSLADHDKLMTPIGANARRAPGDTYATVENAYHDTFRATGNAGTAASARSTRASQVTARPDGK